MKSSIVRAVAGGIIAAAAFLTPAWAGDLLIASPTTFGSLDGSAVDDDHAADGVLTVNGNLTIGPAGSITNNDVPPLINAGPISIVVTGSVEISGGILAENIVTNGNGGDIVVTVGANLTLHSTATISSRRTNGDGSMGNAGSITLKAGGDALLEAGAAVTASCAKNTSAGAIVISAGGNLQVDGSVVSQSALTGIGAAQPPGGGPITLVAANALTIGDTALVSSRGLDPGADLVHLEGCNVVIFGVVESTGPGHVVPNSPSNHLSAPNRPDKPSNSTAGVEVWAGQSLTLDGAAHNGQINADVGQSGGSAGISWVDLFANGNIILAGSQAGAFAVHADAFVTGDIGGIITVKSLSGSITASGRALQASATAGGGAGGQVTIEAGGAGDVLLGSASVQAAGAASGGGTQAGGQISVRSFSGQISGDAAGELNASGDGTANPGSVELQACAGVNYAGTTTPTAVMAAPACGGVPFLPLEPAAATYVVLPVCGCLADTTPPELAGQGADAILEYPAQPQFTAPTASDNFDPAPQVVVVSDVTTPGNCAGTFSRTVTWQAVDCNGNLSPTVSQTITVADTTPPELVSQGTDATIEGPAGPLFTEPKASDFCDSQPTVFVVSDITTAGNCSGAYKRAITWQAVDCSGNLSQTVSQMIAVVDTTPPVLSGQGADATIECPNQPQFTAPTAQDNCDPAPQVLVVSDMTVSGNCGGTYRRTLTWQAVDCTGNRSQTVSQTITVVDTTPPVLSGQGADKLVDCATQPVPIVIVPPPLPWNGGDKNPWGWFGDGKVHAQSRCTGNGGGTSTGGGSEQFKFTAPTASDNCDPAPKVMVVSDVTTLGSCGKTYSHTVTWQAVDCNGNRSQTVSQTYAVVDTTPPVLSGQGADATIECQSPVVIKFPVPPLPGIPIVYTPDGQVGPVMQPQTMVAANSRCIGVPQPPICWPNPFPIPCPGPFPSPWPIPDPIPCPIPDPIPCPREPQFTAPTAHDNCDPAPKVVVVSDVTTPGNCGKTYSRTITWQAVDCSGNLSPTVSQTIAVVDTTPPLLFKPTVNIWIDSSGQPVPDGGNGGSGDAQSRCLTAPGGNPIPQPQFITPVAWDNCDPAPQVQVVGDVTTPGNDGSAATRTLTWQAVDCSGNVSQTVSQTISLPDGNTTPPVLNLPDDITATAETASGSTVDFVVTAVDALGGPVPVVCSTPSGSVFPVGITTVDCSATDYAGNTASGSFAVTVLLDGTSAPSLSVPQDMTVDATGPDGAVVTFEATAVDADGNALDVTSTPASGDTFPVGTTTVTCSADVGNGQTLTGTFTVTVVDTTPPEPDSSDVNVQKASVTLVLGGRNKGKDRLALQGQLRLPRNFAPKQKPVTVSLGTYALPQATLNAKGCSNSRGFAVKLAGKLKNGQFTSRDATLTVSVSQPLLDNLAGLGFANEDVTGKQLVLPVQVDLGGTQYSGSISVSYTARQNKLGAARSAAR